MVFHPTDRPTAAPVEQRGHALHAFDEVWSHQKRAEKQHPKSEAIHPSDRTQETKPHAKTQKAEATTLDCKKGCPFEGVNSARSHLSARSDSDAFTKADARALKGLDFNSGKPMTDAQMDALSHLRKHAMDDDGTGQPLWKKYAPEDPSARETFKNQMFGGNADYHDAQYLMYNSDSAYSREYNGNTVRDYGESLDSGYKGTGNSTTIDFSTAIYSSRDTTPAPARQTSGGRGDG